MSGTVTIQAELLENPCNIAATTVISVVNAGGAVVFSACDNDLPARVRWDTTRVANGRYTIRGQRSCSCNRICSELGSPVGVTVSNGGALQL